MLDEVLVLSLLDLRRTQWDQRFQQELDLVVLLAYVLQPHGEEHRPVQDEGRRADQDEGRRADQWLVGKAATAEPSAAPVKGNIQYHNKGHQEQKAKIMVWLAHVI